MYKTSQLQLCQVLQKALSTYTQAVLYNQPSDEVRRLRVRDLDLSLSRLSVLLHSVFTIIEDDWHENHVTEQYLGGLEVHPEVIYFDDYDPETMGTDDANGLPLTVWLARYFDPSKKCKGEAAIGFAEPVHPIVSACKVYGDRYTDTKFFIVLPGAYILFP